MRSSWLFDPAVLIAAVSLVVSVLSAVWSVVTFRRGGSFLRVHALLYQEVLLLWVFNAGRTQDTIEHVVLGIRPTARSGAVEVPPDVLQLPCTLQPGQSLRREVPAVFLDSRALRRARGGWSSVWLLLGSMQQHRCELLPQREARPDGIGWRLAPRAAKTWRLVPVAAGLVVTASTFPPVTIWPFTVLVAGFFVYAFAVAFFGRQDQHSGFARRRWERWLIVAAVPFTPLAARLEVRGHENWATAVASGYLLAAVVTAVPGGLHEVCTQLATVGTDVAGAVMRVIRRLRRRPSSGSGLS